jgi:hypothetical protein
VAFRGGSTPGGATSWNREEVKGVGIEAVRQKYEDDLLSLPNVVGVGIGERDNQPVIKVLVSHKVPESALQPDEVVPKTLEGHRTDVEAIGIPRAESE